MTDRDPAVLAVFERTRPRSTEGADWDDVLRRGASAERRPPRPVARAMRWAPGLAGGIALAVVLGVMAVRQGGAPPSAAPKGVTGVEALVRVTSIRDGQTDEQAAERMEQVLTDRARIQGITGFAIERSGAQLSVFVPRTHDPEWVRHWIDLVPLLRVVDGKGGIVRSGFDPIAVARAVEVHDAPGPVVYYRAVRDARPGASFIVGPYPSRSEATKGARPSADQVVRIVPVAAETSLTMRLGGGRTRFEARRGGLVAPGAVMAVRARGPHIIVTIAEAARETISGGFRGSFIVPALEELAIGVRAPFADWDPGTGELSFRTQDVEARRMAFIHAGGQADALTTSVRAARVGPVPRPRGQRVPVPGGLRRATRATGGAPIRWSTFRRAVTARAETGTWWVWTADGEAGWSTAGVVSPDSWSFGGCEVDPTRPVVTVCGGAWENPRRTRIVFGRAGDAVRRITVVSRDGVRTEARVANGFYIAPVPIRSGRLRAIVAQGDDGREIGRITRRDPVWGPTL